MIRPCTRDDIPAIDEIINDAAIAYKGVIPDDRWHEPYMPEEELQREIAAGIEFWGWEENHRLIGVMGIQDKDEVTLIRHAYVRTEERGRGIGAELINHLRRLTAKPILIGTWRDAGWAIRFYQRHGWRLVDEAEKNRLLPRFWGVPPRQIETSVVLADDRWRAAR